ncbi:MAG TPA: response regulator, partial [Pirellulales bacterium]
VAVSTERAVPATPDDGEAVRSLQVLLADDNPVNQMTGATMLQKLGHAVEVANNGHEAIERIGAQKFDIVFMDVQMPEMDGLTATREIRKSEHAMGKHIPIVAMTAHAMKGDRERCIEVGMDGYISKPIEAAQLYRAIETYVPRTVAAAPPSKVQDDRSSPDNVLDWAFALEQVQHQPELLQEVGVLFLDEGPKLLAEVQQSIVAGNAAQLRRAAHTLKSSAAIFGARPTIEAAHALEILGQQGTLTTAPGLCAILEAHAQRLLQTLAARLALAASSEPEGVQHPPAR